MARGVSKLRRKDVLDLADDIILPTPSATYQSVMKAVSTAFHLHGRCDGVPLQMRHRKRQAIDRWELAVALRSRTADNAYPPVAPVHMRA